uniref:Uncharacterized protein n=1 Tax=Glossina austeni TaxID=7395 RepID=A0A1A9UYK1_GLOAU
MDLEKRLEALTKEMHRIQRLHESVQRWADYLKRMLELRGKEIERYTARLQSYEEAKELILYKATADYRDDDDHHQQDDNKVNTHTVKTRVVITLPSFAAAAAAAAAVANAAVAVTFPDMQISNLQNLLIKN